MVASTDARVLLYDLECGNLSPQRGRLYVFAYKWLGGPPTRATCPQCGGRHSKVSTQSILDYNTVGDNGLMRLHDRELVKFAHGVMGEADVAITFNGTNFDQKYITTKFMRERLPALPTTRMIDLYQVARSKMRLSPKSLANIQHYLRLKHEKTRLDWDIWTDAGEGDAKAVKYIKNHGAADILVTEELYEDYLKPYVPNHPRLFTDRALCARCGSTVKRDKVVFTYASPKVQYKCRNGHYETRAGV